jgi:hypothetical protein
MERTQGHRDGLVRGRCRHQGAGQQRGTALLDPQSNVAIRDFDKDQLLSAISKAGTKLHLISTLVLCRGHDHVLRRLLGHVLWEEHKYTQAIAAYELSLELNPSTSLLFSSTKSGSWTLLQRMQQGYNRNMASLYKLHGL